MVKHIVMYKLKDATKATELRDLFISMRGKIPQLLDIDSGCDVLDSPRSFDVVLVSTFESLAALKAYKLHPVHIPVQQYAQQIVEKSHSVDYEF